MFVCPPEHSHEKRLGCYSAHGCRCEPCKLRNLEYQRERHRLRHRDRVVVRMEARQMELGLQFLIEMEDEKFDLLVN